MNRNLLLSRANIRKAKGQTAAIAVLVLLASLMMNLWLMLGTDYKKNFDRCYDRLNEGHVNLLAYQKSDKFNSFMEEMLKSRSDIMEYCLTDAFGWVGTFKYSGGEVNLPLVFLDKETALLRNVGRIEIIEDSEYVSGVYLPVLYGETYSAGDEIEITIGSKTFLYTV